MPSQKKPKSIASTQSLSAFVKSICDVMRRSNCASALQYVPELTWILFLRILDAQEAREQAQAEATGDSFAASLPLGFRWQDWAAPYAKDDAALQTHPHTPQGLPHGWKRRELFQAGEGALFTFVNTQLLPLLHTLDTQRGGSAKQKVIGRIMTAAERVRVDSETNFGDVLDRVNQISIDHIDDQHFFTLSQVYEDLLLKMGEKNSDGGQFFTPREVIRAMVRTIEPQPGEHVYDPCCGTGGFLATAYEHMLGALGPDPAATEVERLKTGTFYGREKENLVFPIALANLVLHGIERPRLWHGNTLTGKATYEALFDGAPTQFDVILTNPPFGGKEGKLAQQRYDFETGATQVLFMQQVLRELAEGGRCGVVLDEGLLFRTNETAFVDTKRKLLDECELWCVVSLPGGVFSTAGAGVKTNLLFFTKCRRTERIWYYDLSAVKVGKKNPMTLAAFDGFFKLLPHRGTGQGDSEVSWTIDFAARRARAREEMAPHRAQGQRETERAVVLKDALAQARKSKASEVELLRLRSEITEAEKAAREAHAKADAIDAACYDIKAVNPNAKAEGDTRTAAQIIEVIELRGQEVAQALGRLKGLLNQP